MYSSILMYISEENFFKAVFCLDFCRESRIVKVQNEIDKFIMN